MSIPNLRVAISLIDSKITGLLSERADLEEKLETAVRLRSPILRLPTEILSTIFTIGVLGMTDYDIIMVQTLMLVCRYWAEVALNTPVLWAKISVSPHELFKRAQRHLMLSKSCPLDITINFGPQIEYTNPRSIDEQVLNAIDLFRPVLWRTRSFSLTVTNWPRAYSALLRYQQGAQILENLTIHVYDSIQDDMYSRPVISLFNGCTPNLRACSLTSFHFGWDHKLLTGLSVLRLGEYFNSFAPSPSTLLGVLRQCPELEELALKNISDNDEIVEDDILATSKIHLLRLTSASFTYSGLGLMWEIMNHVLFPNLKSLELAYLENANPLLQELGDQALTRLSLKTLRIESCLFSEMKFVNLLRELPSLVSLQLIDIEDISDITLKAMLSHEPWICPCLEQVTLDGCTSFDGDSL